MALVLQKQAFTPVRLKQELYSDFFTDFETYETSRDVARLINEDAVKNSIRNLLLTNRGDRLFNNSLGSDIRGLLFENAGPATEQLVSDYVRKTIENYEPRANILDIIVNLDVDEHQAQVSIIFSVINNSEPVVLELVLNRIR